ncbi:hypothetical protein ACCO45_008227 [Purpureocillium lilacinum]|uniref:Uncharacterized protein n=1 Tax=Purpureocillium lilacinum TaxID=33203 RepID=A0ACC4DMX3_PURLI
MGAASAAAAAHTPRQTGVHGPRSTGETGAASTGRPGCMTGDGVKESSNVEVDTRKAWLRVRAIPGSIPGLSVACAVSVCHIPRPLAPVAASALVSRRRPAPWGSGEEDAPDVAAAAAAAAAVADSALISVALLPHVDGSVVVPAPSTCVSVQGQYEVQYDGIRGRNQARLLQVGGEAAALTPGSFRRRRPNGCSAPWVDTTPKQPRGAWLSPPPPAVCVLAPRGGLSLVCNSDGRPPPCPSCPAAGSFLDAIFNRRTGNQDIALTSIVDDARGSEAFLPWTTEQRPTLIQQDRRATRAAINAQALASAFARSILLCRLWGGTNAQYAPSQPHLDRASWRFWRSDRASVLYRPGQQPSLPPRFGEPGVAGKAGLPGHHQQNISEPPCLQHVRGMSTKWDTLRRWSTLSASLLAAHNADPSDGTRQLLEDATPSSPCPKLLVINCAPTAACLVGRLGASQMSNCSGSAWGGGGCRPTDPTFCPNCLAAFRLASGPTGTAVGAAALGRSVVELAFAAASMLVLGHAGVRRHGTAGRHAGDERLTAVPQHGMTASVARTVPTARVSASASVLASHRLAPAGCLCERVHLHRVATNKANGLSPDCVEAGRASTAAQFSADDQLLVNWLVLLGPGSTAHALDVGTLSGNMLGGEPHYISPTRLERELHCRPVWPRTTPQARRPISFAGNSGPLAGVGRRTLDLQMLERPLWQPPMRLHHDPARVIPSTTPFPCR